MLQAQLNVAATKRLLSHLSWMSEAVRALWGLRPAVLGLGLCLASSASSSPPAREVELELLACTAVEGSSAATAMASIPCT
mgnify:CR=1 FL=1